MERDLLFGEVQALAGSLAGNNYQPEMELPWTKGFLTNAVERMLIEEDMRKGIVDENLLSDKIFFRRHPERNGLKIRREERDFKTLSQEWLTIRDKLVRPALYSGSEAMMEAAGKLVGEGMGKAMMKPAKVSRPEWSLRQGPAEAVIGKLRLNDSVFIERVLQKDGESLAWYKIFTADGKQGWIRSDGVALDPPEPSAEIHYVVGGKDDLLINIAAHYYKPEDGFKWGEDARYYVMAIAFANKLVNRTTPFVNLPNDNEWQIRDRWKTVGVKVGTAIWIPGKPFMQTLASKVSSGSITFELWKSVKKIVAEIVDWLKFAAAFIAGLLRGALESVYDVFTGIADLVKTVWSVIKSMISGNIINDAKMLYESIRQLDVSQMAGDFMAKWNSDDVWDRGMFRGRVIGYVIAEVLMAIFSVGAITIVKWAGKFGKLIKVLMATTRFAKYTASMASKFSHIKVPPKVLEYLKKVFKHDRDEPAPPKKPGKVRTPTPGESEAFVHQLLLRSVPARDWKTQVRFLNGKEIPVNDARRLSTKPDSYSKSLNLAVEVKSHPPYDKAKMVKTIKDQHGGRIVSLPPGTRSWMYWDLRGHSISADLDVLGTQLRKELGGKVIFEKIVILTDKGMKEF